MEKLKRFGVSMEEELQKRFDKFIKSKKYPNRSEAIRDLVRNALVEEQWEKKSGEVIGVLVIIYDHHKRELSSALLKKEHRHTNKILTTIHIHLDSKNCLEAKVIKGKPEEVRKIADELIAMKGVKFGRLVPAATGNKML